VYLIAEGLPATSPLEPVSDFKIVLLSLLRAMIPAEIFLLENLLKVFMVLLSNIFLVFI
jgi:hypothetical protein